MYSPIRYFICLLVLFYALIEAKRESFELTETSQENASCLYDHQIYFTDNLINYNESDEAKCSISFAYSVSSRFIVLTLANIDINCNGKNNIVFWDENGKDFDYCDSEMASTLTFYSDDSKWLGISRLGSLKFEMKLEFRDCYDENVTDLPVTTNSPTTQTDRPSSPTCGVQKIKPDENGLSRIVGGQIAVPNSWPWQVGLKQNGQFFCGAALISDQWVLTAAHCETYVNGLEVHLGDHDIISDNSGETIVNASEWISHPDYTGKGKYPILNDIALIKLSKKINFTEKIQPVCLPNGRKPKIDQIGVVTGWGRTMPDGSGPISPLLRQVTIPIISKTICDYLDMTNQICAGVPELNNYKDACQGDSGSPFVMKDRDSGAYYISGVVSYGELCEGRGAYTDVSAYENWISNTTTGN